jgi:hypothetical protein
MAAPHVAGAAALLRQRHSTWTVAQLKSALVLTAKPVPTAGSELPATREGAGLIQVPAANDPLLFASPTGLSFGLLHTGATASRSLTLGDAGGGAGTWSVSVALQSAPAGVSVTAAAAVTVPGALGVTAAASPSAAEGDVTGFVTLTLGAATRRLPFWFYVEDPKLGSEPHGILTRTGTYAGTTRGKPSAVSAYRYPDTPSGIQNRPTGPEQVFRVTLRRPVANFGVVTLGTARAAVPQPRVVIADDENHLTGYPGLPIVINPYLESFGAARPVAGAVRPGAGTYDIVFDTVKGTKPGPYSFRFWVNDVTPPTVKLLTPLVRRPAKLELAVADGGAGVDPLSLEAKVDGKSVDVAYSRGRAEIDLTRIGRGTHRLSFQASDYQELKNMENVPRILPNTQSLAAAFRVR